MKRMYTITKAMTDAYEKVSGDSASLKQFWETWGKKLGFSVGTVVSIPGGFTADESRDKDGFVEIECPECQGTGLSQGNGILHNTACGVCGGHEDSKGLGSVKVKCTTCLDQTLGRDYDTGEELVCGDCLVTCPACNGEGNEYPLGAAETCSECSGEQVVLLAQAKRWEGNCSSKQVIANPSQINQGRIYRRAAKSLTFSELQTKGVLRCEEIFRPLKAFHPSKWTNFMGEEYGEICREIGRMDRLTEEPEQRFLGIFGDSSAINQRIEGHRLKAIEECADLVQYTSLLVASLGGDLGEAIVSKFNATSIKRGSKYRLVEVSDTEVKL